MVDDRHQTEDGGPGGDTTSGGRAAGDRGPAGDPATTAAWQSAGSTASWSAADEEEGAQPADPWAGHDDEAEPPGGGATSVLPPARPDSTNLLPQSEDAARWSARAEVPTRRPVATEPWMVEEPPPPRRTWWPVLIGLLILALLALIGLGLWLGLKGGGQPTVAESATGTPTTSPSAAPTPSASRSPSAAPTTAQTVVIPPLVGVPVDDAIALLDQAGLKHNVQQRADGSVPPGTVLATDPGAGASVPVGSSVTLVAASAPPPPPKPTPSNTSSPSPTPSSPSPSK